jgi:hypothetical protein
MILKFKDSKNNWKYVQLGDFTINKVNISTEISEVIKKYTVEELTNGLALDEVIKMIRKYMKNKLGLYLETPYVDENIVHQISDIIIVHNEMYEICLDKDGFDGIFVNEYSKTCKVPHSITYIISDECYLMNDNGKTIEKLM